MKINNPFETYTRGMTARERRIRSKWTSLFVASILVCIWLSIKVANLQEDVEKNEAINSVLQSQKVRMEKEMEKEMQNKIDSLHDKSSSISTINGRYELSLDHLKQVYPKAAKEFEYFMNTKTK
jgi:tRNA U34 5-carboxymethylaminomethyl modifying enzyme MnmG/GidA